MNEYRHACLKDLNNYFRIEDYFSGLSFQETKLIRANLGITSTITGTYDEIKQKFDKQLLNVSCKYIITDFQTIYLSNTGEVWGLDNNPSGTYKILLTPVTESMFSRDVYLIDKNGQVLDAQYDITSELLGSEEISTKGKITYLKDQNGNSAYYDFKNIKHRITISPDIDSRLHGSVDIDVFTFNIPTESPEVYQEASDYIYNNTLGVNCINNVFLNKCFNIQLQAGSSNNLFVQQVSNIDGQLINAVVKDLFSDDTLSIQFNTANDRTIAIKSIIQGDRILFDVITLQSNNYLHV